MKRLIVCNFLMYKLQNGIKMTLRAWERVLNIIQQKLLRSLEHSRTSQRGIDTQPFLAGCWFHGFNQALYLLINKRFSMKYIGKDFMFKF